MIEAVFGLLLGIVIGLAYRPCRHALTEHFTVVSLEIVGANMPVITEGTVDKLRVRGLNKALREVPLTAPVTLTEVLPDGTNALQAPTVAADGTFDFVAMAPDGDYKLTGTDGTLTSNTYVETVQADNAVASLLIGPA